MRTKERKGREERGDLESENEWVDLLESHITAQQVYLYNILWIGVVPILEATFEK
jgi:hypothetical protein